MVTIHRTSGVTSPVSTGQIDPVAPSSAGALSTGTVKWVNTEKGYGTISLPDRSDLHFSTKDVAGLAQLPAGQYVTFEVVGSPKGPIAVNVRPATAPSPGPIEDDFAPAPARPPVSIDFVDARDVLANGVEGTVKWFSADSGYGFIVADRRGDIYVDSRALAGLKLEPGQAVVFDVVSSPKGPVASNVRLADEA